MIKKDYTELCDALNHLHEASLSLLRTCWGREPWVRDTYHSVCAIYDDIRNSIFTSTSNK